MIIDSKKEQLAGSAVIGSALHSYDLKGIPVYAALAAIAKETTMPGCDVIQFGNTVFITHFSADKKSVFMRALNIDTAKNYVDNGERYIRYLLTKNVNTMVTQYSVESYGAPFQVLKRSKLGNGMTFENLRAENGDFITIVHLKGKA